ncbi:MAG: hypothetical protein KBC95_01635 [Candidatus Peribacteraceae bacterium]|nr:hypothetical protein [Candidatus Peribacteraceae bacterium]
MPLTVIGIALLIITALWARSEHQCNQRSAELEKSAPKTWPKAPSLRGIRWLLILAQILLAVAGLVMAVLGQLPKQ